MQKIYFVLPLVINFFTGCTTIDTATPDQATHDIMSPSDYNATHRNPGAGSSDANTSSISTSSANSSTTLGLSSSSSVSVIIPPTDTVYTPGSIWTPNGSSGIMWWTYLNPDAAVTTTVSPLEGEFDANVATNANQFVSLAFSCAIPCQSSSDWAGWGFRWPAGNTDISSHLGFCFTYQTAKNWKIGLDVSSGLNAEYSYALPIAATKTTVRMLFSEFYMPSWETRPQPGDQAYYAMNFDHVEIKAPSPAVPATLNLYEIGWYDECQ